MSRIALAVLVLFLAWALTHRAEAGARWDTAALLQLGQDEGKLPLWYDLGDPARGVIVGPRFYSCLTDAQTGNSWVAVTGAQKVRAYLDGGTWLSAGPPRDIVLADWLVCFPDPAGFGPAAIGEPAYWTLSRTPTLELDLPRLNLPANLAGPVVTGERCGTATASPGYYLLPRLAVGGRVPVTRCL